MAFILFLDFILLSDLKNFNNQNNSRHDSHPDESLLDKKVTVCPFRLCGSVWKMSNILQRPLQKSPHAMKCAWNSNFDGSIHRTVKKWIYSSNGWKLSSNQKKSAYAQRFFGLRSLIYTNSLWIVGGWHTATRCGPHHMNIMQHCSKLERFLKLLKTDS